MRIRHYLAAATALIALAVPATAVADTGPYLDIATWPNIDQSTTPGPEGVPQVRYAGVLEDNPVTVEQWALQHWTAWLSDGQQADLDAFTRGADWLLEHQQADGTWTYAFDFSGAGAVMKAPWISALAQGQAMSVLVRAYDHTQDRRYLDAAVLALSPFSVPADQGGVLSDWDGTPWYEEYPTPALHVLNGFEFALVGLHDLAAYSPDAQQLYDAGVGSLIAHVGVFDVPSAHGELYGAIGGSRMLVVGSYPRIQAVLTRYLATLSDSQTLRDYAARWEGYLIWKPPVVKPVAVVAPAPVVIAKPVGCHVGGYRVMRSGVSCVKARHTLRRHVLGLRLRGWRCFTARFAHCRKGNVRALASPSAWR